MSAADCCNQQQMGKHRPKVTKPATVLNYKGEADGTAEVAAGRTQGPVKETYRPQHYGGSGD